MHCTTLFYHMHKKPHNSKCVQYSTVIILKQHLDFSAIAPVVARVHSTLRAGGRVAAPYTPPPTSTAATPRLFERKHVKMHLSSNSLSLWGVAPSTVDPYGKCWEAMILSGGVACAIYLGKKNVKAYIQDREPVFFAKLPVKASATNMPIRSCKLNLDLRRS